MDYCRYLIEKISEIEKFGYRLAEKIENSNNYKLGLSYINDLINQRVSLAFYDKNPLNGNTSELAICIKIFKGSNHIDLSRLGSDKTEINKYCNYQYFILRKDDTTLKIIDYIFAFLFKQYNILSGETWINIKYDPRDDY